MHFSIGNVVKHHETPYMYSSYVQRVTSRLRDCINKFNWCNVKRMSLIRSFLPFADWDGSGMERNSYRYPSIIN